MNWISRTVLLAGTFAIATSALAWNAVGHRIIATIALSKLDPKARKEAERLLAAAPNGASTDFVAVSTWADETRTRENGLWHYIDYYFRSDGKPATHQPDAENAVWAIDKFSHVLEDRSQPEAARAEALRFLIHFVGDIHQPLHASSRETDAHPAGDRGGNDFHIEAPAGFSGGRPPRNLHAFWDLGGGLFEDGSPEAIRDEAQKLMARYPRRSFRNVGDRKPEDWALEGFDITKRFVYNLQENQPPDQAYVNKAKEISGERATLAGYRLADLLNRLIG